MVLGSPLSDLRYGTDADDLDALAQQERLNGRPFVMLADKHATVLVDPSAGGTITTDVDRFAQFEDVLRWAEKCIVRGRGMLRIQIANGLWSMEGQIRLRHNSTAMHFRGSSINELYATKCYFGAISTTAPYLVNCQLHVSTPVPAYVVPGWPFTCQNFISQVGDGHAITGAHRVRSISADRMVIHFEFNSPRSYNLTDTTGMLNSGNSYGMNQCRVRFQKAAITAAKGWDGSGIEAFLNVEEGAYCEIDRLGMAYHGAAGTPQELIMVRGAGSHLWAIDNCSLVGAGNMVVRGYGDSYIRLAGCGLGGGGTAQTLLMLQGGVQGNMSGMSIGGASRYGIVAGACSRLYSGNYALASCENGVAGMDDGSGIVNSCRISNCVTGIRRFTPGLYHDNVSFVSNTNDVI